VLAAHAPGPAAADRPAAGLPARRQRYRRRRQTTDVSEQNNIGPSGEAVTIVAMN